VAKLRERISVSKWTRQKSDLERFDLKKFNDIEVKEKYQVEISNRFTVLEGLDDSFDISNAWESIRKNIKTSTKYNLGYHRLKHNKQWFDYESSKLIDQPTVVAKSKPSQLRQTVKFKMWNQENIYKKEKGASERHN
jgi:hypothetical protein